MVDGTIIADPADARVHMLMTMTESADTSFTYEQAERTFKQLRWNMYFLGVNMLLQGGMILYFRILHGRDFQLNNDLMQIQLICAVVWTSIACCTGMLSILAGYTKSQQAGRICVIGIFLMIIFQVCQTVLVLAFAHESNANEINKKAETLLIVETIMLCVMDLAMVNFVRDFLLISDWFKVQNLIKQHYVPVSLDEVLLEGNTGAPRTNTSGILYV